MQCLLGGLPIDDGNGSIQAPDERIEQDDQENQDKQDEQQHQPHRLQLRDKGGEARSVHLCSLTFPVTGARSRAYGKHGRFARVRVHWGVRQHRK